MAEIGKRYPLTTAQIANIQNLQAYPDAPQVLNVAASLVLRANLDFTLLREALIQEYARNESLRVRLTAPDTHGKVYQYVVPQESAQPGFADFSGMPLEQAEQTLQSWAEQPLPHWDAPLHKIVMIALPDGYKGIFVKLDHLITDSTAIIVMINDIMELYCHLQFGTPVPPPLTSYIDAVRRDLARQADAARVARDRDFWSSQLEAGEPIYTDISGSAALRDSRLRRGQPSLRAADIERKDLRVGKAVYHLEPEPTARLLRFCHERGLSVTAFLLMGVRSYLSKINNGQQDVGINCFVSRRSGARTRLCGGVRVHSYPCRTVLHEDLPFLEGVRQIQSQQMRVYRHADFDPQTLAQMESERFGKPAFTTYTGVGLTYQPLPMRLQNEHIRGLPYRVKWLTNGTAVQPLYLNVLHTPYDLGMEFYCKYQLARHTENDVELFYYYLMRILFGSMQDPEASIGALLARV